MAPDLLFHPVLNEAEALAGVSDREVIYPTAQHRVDQIDHPIHGLGSMPAEHTLEFPQQCRSFLELRRVVRTPDARRLRMQRKSNPRKPKLSPRLRSTIRLFSSLISTCRAANSSRRRFSTAGSSQSCRGWASIKITRSSAKRAYSMPVYAPYRVASFARSSILSTSLR